MDPTHKTSFLTYGAESLGPSRRFHAMETFRFLQFDINIPMHGLGYALQRYEHATTYQSNRYTKCRHGTYIL